MYRNTLLVVISLLINSCSDLFNNDDSIIVTGKMARYPSWSYDGQKIIFTKYVDMDNCGIWSIHASGSPDSLLFGNCFAKYPEWNSDSETFLYTYSPPWPGEYLYQYNISAHDTIKINQSTGGALYGSYNISGNIVLYKKTIDSSELIRGIIKVDLENNYEESELINYAWFPNHKWADSMFVYVKNPADEGQGAYDEVFIYQYSDQSETQVTTGFPKDCSNPELSPDNKWIAFQTQTTKGFMEIYIIRTDGTGQRKLVSHASAPSWSPSGEWIAYANEEFGDGRIWKIRVSDGYKVPVSSPAPDSYWENYNLPE